MSAADDRPEPGTRTARDSVVTNDPCVPPPVDISSTRAAGTELGRYIVLERLGAGGMGVVYSAYDPQLDRRVAVKLLHDHAGGAQSSEQRERLIAEAQAIARLNHPNVVTVHDVGMTDGHVFIAMEYIAGKTFGRWLQDADPHWSGIVRMLTLAGRGLAAAHREGVVHRDFKPDNVIVDEDGRPRVLDFGLALQTREDEELEASLRSIPESRRSRSGKENSLTSGGLVGTPAYMAPEQYLGLSGDARTDQFSFCITLWEALYGVRPFPGATRAMLGAAIVSGPIEDPPAPGDVPRELERVLRRGLSKEPEERWPTMDALLSALALRPQTDRRRMLGVGLVGVGVLTGVGMWTMREQPVDPCAAGDERAAAIWGPKQRKALQRAFVETSLPFAERSAHRALRGLDDYRQQWVSTYREACEATHVRREQSPEQLDRKMACLMPKYEAWAATIAVLTAGGSEAVEHAAATVVGIPSPATCKQAGTPGDVPPPKPEVARQVEALRKEAAAVSPRVYSGAANDARALLEDLLKRAQSLGYVPLVAELRLKLGHALSVSGHADLAEDNLRRAAFEALSSRHDEVLASAASLLVRVEGIERSHYDRALLWAEHARAAIERLPEPGRIATLLEYRECRVLADKGDVERALPHCEEAVARFADEVGPDHVDTASARQGLGIAYYMAGRLDEAEREFEAAYETSMSVHGPDHPSQSVMLGALAAICYSRDRGAQCIDPFERAYRSVVAARGPDHPSVGDYANNLALALLAAGRIEDAEPLAEDAIRIREASGGEHPGIAASHRILGQVAHARGELDAALEHYDAAVTGAIATRGSQHPDVVDSYELRAELRIAREEVEPAIADLRGAVAAAEGIAVPPAKLGRIEWALGRTLLVHDLDALPEAAEHVRAAQERLPSDAPEQADIAVWLAEHGPRLTTGDAAIAPEE